MGVLKGSISFTRFKVVDKPENEYLDAVKHYAFNEIEEDSDAEVSSGWVSLIEEDTQLDAPDFLKGSYLTLLLRVDNRRVPTTALKNNFKKVLKEKYIAGEKLSKSDRQEIKETIRLQLLKKVIPTTKTYSMVWNIKNGSIVFESANAKVCDMFIDIFNETFGLKLKRMFPYTLAEQLIDSSLHSSLRNSTETDFISRTNFPSNYSENVVELLDIKRFLGQEFLIWLWNCGRTSTVFKNCSLWCGDRMVLISGEDTKVTCEGDIIVMGEVKKGLAQGRKMIECRFSIEKEDREYEFTLDDIWMNFKSCKLPKVPLDKDDMDGAFLERMYLLEEVVGMVDHLFKLFIETKFSIDWKTFVNSISDWLQDICDDKDCDNIG